MVYLIVGVVGSRRRRIGSANPYVARPDLARAASRRVSWTAGHLSSSVCHDHVVPEVTAGVITAFLLGDGAWVLGGLSALAAYSKSTASV